MCWPQYVETDLQNKELAWWSKFTYHKISNSHQTKLYQSQKLKRINRIGIYCSTGSSLVFIQHCTLSRDGRIHSISSAFAWTPSLHFAWFKTSSFFKPISVFSSTSHINANISVFCPQQLFKTCRTNQNFCIYKVSLINNLKLSGDQRNTLKWRWDWLLHYQLIAAIMWLLTQAEGAWVKR